MDKPSPTWDCREAREYTMNVRELLILIIGILVGGNLGILMTGLIAMARQADEQASSAELAWVPAKDVTEH